VAKTEPFCSLDGFTMGFPLAGENVQFILSRAQEDARAHGYWIDGSGKD